MGLILSRVPVWVWALVALLAYGGFQHHRATSAQADLLKQKTWAAQLEHERALLAEGAAEVARVKGKQHEIDLENERIARKADGVVVGTVLADTRTQLDRLRVTTATRTASAVSPGASAATGSGSDGAAAELGSVFDECASRLVEMGQQTEELGIRLRGLQAWAGSAVGVCGE